VGHQLTVRVEHGVTKPLPVFAKVGVPKAELVTKRLDFGLVQYEHTAVQPLVIRNTSTSSSCAWAVRELHAAGVAADAIARIEARDERAARALPPMPVHELEAVARALRHMAAALGAAEDQRRTLGQRIITLQEDERARLGRELHDEFGQHLTALHADAAWLTRHLQTQGAARPEAQEVLAAITGHVRQIQQVLRSVLTRLRPLGLASGRDDDTANDDESFTLQRLQDLLRTLVDSWDRRPNASFRVQLHLDPKDDGHQRLPAAQALAVYRITQEALTNIARHAQARQAQVHLQMQADGRLLWSVQDDGVGLPDPAQALLHGSGLGGPGPGRLHQRIGPTVRDVRVRRGGRLPAVPHRGGGGRKDSRGARSGGRADGQAGRRACTGPLTSTML
jgi:signal transduction histidine kinase